MQANVLRPPPETPKSGHYRISYCTGSNLWGHQGLFPSWVGVLELWCMHPSYSLQTHSPRKTRRCRSQHKRLAGTVFVYYLRMDFLTEAGHTQSTTAAATHFSGILVFEPHNHPSSLWRSRVSFSSQRPWFRHGSPVALSIPQVLIDLPNGPQNAWGSRSSNRPKGNVPPE